MTFGIFCRKIGKGFFKEGDDAEMNRLRIQTGIGIWSVREFQVLKDTTDLYIECEEAAMGYAGSIF